MPAMMEAPVNTVGVTLGPVMADNTRTVHGQHPIAASSSDKGGSGIDGVSGFIVGVIGIVIRVIVVIDAADKDPAEMMVPVDESMSGEMCNARPGNGCRNARRCRADGAAADEGAARAAGAETAEAMTTPTAGASATTSSAARVGSLADHRCREKRSHAQGTRRKEKSN